MTILGKILVFFVLFLSLVWTGLTVNAFATRANYKTALDDATAKIKVAVDGAKAQEEYSRQQKVAADVVLLQQTEQIKNLTKSVNNLTAENEKTKNDLTLLQAAQQKNADNEQQTTTARSKLQLELDEARKRLGTLETALNDALIAVQKSKDEQLRSELAMKAAERARDEAQGLLNKGRQGGALAGAPTVPEGFRATVLSVSGDQVSISLGINAGLAVNSTLDISRTGKDARYVGRLLITKVEPFGAVGRFIPPAGVRVPSGDALPRAGDIASVIR